MTVTRRGFIRSGAMTVLLTGLALDSAPLAFARQSDTSQDFKTPVEAQREPNFYFKRETFEPYVDGVFKLSAGRSVVEATLLSVRDCTPNPKSDVTPKSRPTECFALVFRAKERLTDLTTIYGVEHGALGKFSLFLTYREGARGEHLYEAVFNRPV